MLPSKTAVFRKTGFPEKSGLSEYLKTGLLLSHPPARHHLSLPVFAEISPREPKKLFDKPACMTKYFCKKTTDILTGDGYH